MQRPEQAAVVGRVQEWLERYLEAEEIVAEEAPDVVVRFQFPTGFPAPVGPPGGAPRESAPSEWASGSALQPCREAASSLRKAWELGRDPIENLTALLEEKGIKIGVIAGSEAFEACAFWAESERHIPVIVRHAGVPGDRARFRMAHELGHLLLSFPKEWDTVLVEQGANCFASELLLPTKAVRAELGDHRHTISLYELHLLKHKYGVSMQTWLSRAKTQGILAEEDAERLLSPFRETDGKGKEPGDKFPPEPPTRLERLVVHALAEGWISERRASELLGRPFRQFTQEVAVKHGGLPIGVCV